MLELKRAVLGDYGTSQMQSVSAVQAALSASSGVIAVSYCKICVFISGFFIASVLSPKTNDPFSDRLVETSHCFCLDHMKWPTVKKKTWSVFDWGKLFI